MRDHLHTDSDGPILDALLEIGATMAAGLPVEATLDTIVAQACEHLGGAAAALYQFEPGTTDLRITHARNLAPDFTDEVRVPWRMAAVGLAVAEGRAISVPDTHQAAVTLSLPASIRTSLEQGAMKDFGALIAAPLIANGQSIGGLVVYYHEAHAFSTPSIRVIELFARQAALALHNATLRERVQTYDALQDLLLSLSVGGSVESVMETSLGRLADLSQSVFVAVWGPTPDRTLLRLIASSDGRPNLRRELERHLWPLEPESPLSSVRAFLSGESVLLENLEPTIVYVPVLKRIAAEHGIHAIASVPIETHTGRSGVLSLYFGRQRRFRADEVHRYKSYGAVVGLIMQTSELIRQTWRLSANEERTRLARELHDSITQSLFSMTLTAKAARRSLAQNPSGTDTLLADLQGLAQAALAEMRALIYELRPAALHQDGLIGALQKRAEATEGRTGIPVRVEIKGERRLRPEEEEAFYYIAREALHNAVRHAHASQVKIRLSFDEHLTQLIIEDNGAGFDLPRAPAGLGLTTMRERASQIGAALAVQSRRQGGTTVALSLLHNRAHQDQSL